MSNVQEKDNFWIYVAVLVIAVMGTVFVVRGGEHGKYESTKKAIAEDASNSAYRNNTAIGK